MTDPDPDPDAEVQAAIGTCSPRSPRAGRLMPRSPRSPGGGGSRCVPTAEHGPGSCAGAAHPRPGPGSPENPGYAGVYVFGRYASRRTVDDPDWEDAAPAALAMHPQRERRYTKAKAPLPPPAPLAPDPHHPTQPVTPTGSPNT